MAAAARDVDQFVLLEHAGIGDLAGAGWPAPEVAVNLNTAELGDLGLTGAEEDAIVAFMRTLTDR